ncbi:MAG: hypothetical protein ACR2IH_13835 [Pyrinomonadaceae bacterium]
MKPVFAVFTLLLLCISAAAQRPTAVRPRAAAARPRIPAAVPVKQANDSAGTESDRTYTNSQFGFEITLPEHWVKAGDDFREEMRSKGFDLDLKAPDDVSAPNKIRIDRALKNVVVLLTAYRSVAGASDSGILRISAEDLTAAPEIRDAVDYFDLMRSQYRLMKLPTDFKYSETQAEKLGTRQFAFLDISSAAGKKRLYATIKNRHAIMFTLSYKTDQDLQNIRQMIARGKFSIK